MKILFYAPFKPLDHPNPSGDQIIGKGLRDFLVSRGHSVRLASRFRCRWVFWKPWLLPRLLRENRRTLRHTRDFCPDIWLTYHTYYKAPDVLGPRVCKDLDLPYIVFQGIYSTKRRRALKTWPGYMLNTAALKQTRHVFTNKRKDLVNLDRILAAKDRTYVAPGIVPEDFFFDKEARQRLRQSWRIDPGPVVISAAMFRPDVKTQGLALLIRACGGLAQKGLTFSLIIAGDGTEKPRIEDLARRHLPDRVRFVGRIPRSEMYQFYSAGDVFAFPGIRESLGMVFLEAQSCGVPVVAFANEGVPEVVRHLKTGILAPAFNSASFARGIETLIQHKTLRKKMGRAGSIHVRTRHDINKNYIRVETILNTLTGVHPGDGMDTGM
jgi:glycosyltransferase involved in cell wall biosynthesis